MLTDGRTTDDRRRTKSDDNSSPGLKLKKLCPVIPTSNQDGRQAKNRKKGDENLIVHCCFSVSQNELTF
jgi:hypothetical protein